MTGRAMATVVALAAMAGTLPVFAASSTVPERTTARGIKEAVRVIPPATASAETGRGLLTRPLPGQQARRIDPAALRTPQGRRLLEAPRPQDRRNVAPTATGTQDLACTSQVVLSAGVPYLGDTTGQSNSYDTTDYPGLGWDETGPDVVHEITIAAPADLRIHLAPDPVTYPDLDVILLDGTGGPCDTSSWTHAGDHTVVAPDMAPGTYYLIVDGYTPSDFGAYELTVGAAQGLLLVDDDGSGDAAQCSGGCPDVRSYYVDALSNMTTPPPFTVWDVATQGTPDEATLNNSKQVVWFTGGAYDAGMTVTPTDEDRLARYLATGGRLLLIGQDILWDVTGGTDGRLADGSLFADYLQVNQVYHDVWTSQTSSFSVHGVVGNPISDQLNCNDSVYFFDQFTTAAGAPFTAYADSLLSPWGEAVFYNDYVSGTTSSQKPVGIRYESTLGVSDYFKTMFLAFAPEASNPANVLAEMTNLFETTLAWMEADDSTLCDDPYVVSADFDDSTTGNGNGIPEPGETFDLVVTLTNNDSVGHHIKLYLGFEDYYVTRFTPYCGDLGTVAAGGTGQATFRMQMLSSTPVGYRVRPEVNVVTVGTSEAYCTRAGFGIFVGQADVLVVKDEWLLPNTTGVDAYTSLLNGLGYSTAVWDADLFGAPTYDTYYLSNDRMRYYDFVVWLTGFDWIYTLTPAPWEAALGIDPEVELAAYLDNRMVQQGEPGRLLLSSQDYLFDRYLGVSGSIPTNDFAYTHLRVGSVVQDHLKDTTGTITGVPGVYASDFVQLGVQNGQTFTNYGDRIDVAPGVAGTFGLWAYQFEPVYMPAAVVNADPTNPYRFAFMPFAFENVQDGTPGGFHSRQRFLEKLLCQMQMGPADTVPPCGYAPPRNLTGVSLSIVPNDGSGAYVSWTPVTFTNDRWDASLGAYEPITGFYRLRKGDLSTLNTGPQVDFAIESITPTPAWAESGSPAPGIGWGYAVVDYQDVFGVGADLD